MIPLSSKREAFAIDNVREIFLVDSSILNALNDTALNPTGIFRSFVIDPTVAIPCSPFGNITRRAITLVRLQVKRRGSVESTHILVSAHRESLKLASDGGAASVVPASHLYTIHLMQFMSCTCCWYNEQNGTQDTGKLSSLFTSFLICFFEVDVQIISYYKWINCFVKMLSDAHLQHFPSQSLLKRDTEHILH